VRYVVYGAGAIGGVVGGRLHQHGHDVILLARGAHLDAIRTNGLRVDDVDGRVVVRVDAVATPDEIDWRDDDVVLLAVKSQDTVDALDALAAVAPPGIAIACVQNGVANERAALRRFTDVYAVCVMCPATHLEPGVVVASSSPITGLLDIGRYPHGIDDRARTIAGALSRSTFESVPRADVMRWKYQKLLMNLANVVEAACGPEGRASEVAKLATREALACYAAAGIDCASRDEDRARRGDKLQLRDVGGRPRGGGSTWQSLARGTGALETDYLNGEIVLLGRLHGVPTPVNALLQRVARRLARTNATPGSVTPDELLSWASGGVPA